MQGWSVALYNAKWSVIALGVSFASFTAGFEAQPLGPEALAENFVQAWNTHDAKAFGDLFSEDADWIPVSGVRVKGRGEIQSVLGKEHVTWARTTAIKVADIEVRLIGHDLALVLFRWEIVSKADAEGKTASPLRGNTMMVAGKRANRWIVIAGQAARAPSVP